MLLYSIKIQPHVLQGAVSCEDDRQKSICWIMKEDCIQTGTYRVRTCNLLGMYLLLT